MRKISNPFVTGSALLCLLAAGSDGARAQYSAAASPAAAAWAQFIPKTSARTSATTARAQSNTAAAAAARNPEYQALFKRMYADPSNLDVSFQFAELAARLGDYEAAIGALERMLFYNPNLPRVKLELGVLYYRIGGYQVSRSYFEQAVATPGAPPDVQIRVNEFLGEIDKHLTPHKFGAFVHAGMRHQTNANAGPGGLVVRALGQDATLSNESARTADWNTFIVGGATYSYEVNSSLAAEASLVGYYAKQEKLSVNANDPTRGAYVDYDTFGALDARDVTPSTGAGAPKSKVNEQAVTKSEGFLLRATRSVESNVLAATGGTAACNCEYTRWGLWSMNTTRGTDSQSVVDRSPVNFWVAGQRPPSAADVPTSGSATYSGHVITNVQNNGSMYTASSNFTNTVNFGAATNQLSVQVGTAATNGSTLDGASFAGNLSLKADRRDFGGTIAGTLDRSMTMNGSFFKGASGPVGEMGGNVKVTGPTSYTGSGIFAGSTVPPPTPR